MFTQADKDAILAPAVALRDYVRPLPVDDAPPPPPPPPTGLQDFITRRTGPGVVRWFDFDSAASFGNNTQSQNYGWSSGTSSAPVLDTTVKASGVSSIKFSLPGLSGSNAGGSWYTNFSPDLLTQFGENSEFFVQQRIRWNQAFCNTVFYDKFFTDRGPATFVDATHISVPGNQTVAFRVNGGVRAYDSGGAIIGYAVIVSSAYNSAAGATIVVLNVTQGNFATISTAWTGSQQGGKKFFDVGTGQPPPPSNLNYYSDTDLKRVVQTYYQCNFPILYGYSKGGNVLDSEPIAGYDFALQNAMPAPRCLYSKAGGKQGPIVGCANVYPDEWMTFQLGITLGPRVGAAGTMAHFSPSRRRLWVAREGQPSVLAIDVKPGVPGYYDLQAGDPALNQLFGKTWMFPYLTNKDPLQPHPLCTAHYDELIISTQQIADPA